MSKAYESVDEMWRGVIIALRNETVRGSRVAPMRELRGWMGKLKHGCDSTFLVNPRRKLSSTYASAELLWYLSRSDNGEALLPYAPSYEHYLDGDKRAFGAYGHRLLKNSEGDDLLELSVGLLRKFNDTRQCVVSIWLPTDLRVAVHGHCKDLPCTCLWQFFDRDGALDMVTYMRSNDTWKGLPYDVYCFTCIQRLLAGTLGLAVGEYTHCVGSLHMYEQNRAAALESLDHYILQGLSNGWDPAGLEDAQEAVDFEASMRKSPEDTSMPSHMYGTLLHDSMACVAAHWGCSLPVRSPALSAAFRHKERNAK
jgi:hypothetical protein